MKIIMITDYQNALRQGIKQYISMDTNKIKKIFKSQGYEVQEYTFEEIMNKDSLQLEDETIIYTSSQNLEYKRYIDDIIYSLSKKNTLIPRYEIFKSHENKGYQEILKKETGIDSLKNFYFANKQGLIKNSHLLGEYPIIFKRIYGAGSSNVFKVNSYEDLINKVEKSNKPNDHKKKRLGIILKKYIFKKKYVPEEYNDDQYMGAFVLQEFIQGLKEDWKVLVFGSKYYVLNRKIRKNDFRASGSGELSYITPPPEVLNYAREIFEKLNIPFVSLDIGFDGEKCNLIEFQGTHFGPYTIVNSPYFFKYEDECWRKVDRESNLEEEYVKSTIKYIEEN